MTQHAAATGQVISTVTTTAQQAYQQLLAALAVKYNRSVGKLRPGQSKIMYVGKLQPSTGRACQHRGLLERRADHRTAARPRARSPPS